MAEKMEEKIVKSVIPIYSVGILWLMYSVVFSIHTSRNIAIASILCFLAYSILSDIIPNKVIKVKVREIPPNTGNSIANEYIERGRKNVIQLNKLSSNLEDTSIVSQVQDLEHTLIKILDFITEFPENARHLRTFMDYYLPTTIKLLENYEHFISQGVEGEAVVASLSRIESTIDILDDAFSKQLEALFENRTQDVDLEISVLKDILKREGFSENSFPMDLEEVYGGDQNDKTKR